MNHTKSLEIRKVSYASSPNHPDIAKSYNNLGNAYRNKGEFDKTIENYTKSLEIRKKAYESNPNHPDIAASYNNLGNAYSAKGEFDKAIEYLTKAHEVISYFEVHQYKKQIEQGLISSVIMLAKEHSINTICVIKLLGVCLSNDLKFLDYQVQLGISNMFYNNNDLELSLAANQLALIFAKNNKNATDRKKQSILHNTGCLYNIMSQKAQNDNDQEKSQEYALKAEESFQKALSYSNTSEHNAGLCTEYANFLIRQSKFKEAFKYLQKSIASNDKTSGLQYGEIEKEVIADILKQSIEKADKQEVTLNAQEYAYYLSVANYEQFKELDCNELLPKEQYLKQFTEFCVREDNNNYVSYLLLSDAFKLCTNHELSLMYANVSNNLRYCEQLALEIVESKKKLYIELQEGQNQESVIVLTGVNDEDEQLESSITN